MRRESHGYKNSSGTTATSNKLSIDSGDGSGGDNGTETVLPMPNNRSSAVTRATTRSDASGSKTKAVPGRPRRKRTQRSKQQQQKRSGFCHRFYARWLKGSFSKTSSSSSSSFGSILIPVLLWYSLGVISIGSTKLLLLGKVFGHIYDHGVSPLYLTLQQQMIGTFLLRYLLKIRFLGMTSGLQPWPTKSTSTTIGGARSRRNSYSVYERLRRHEQANSANKLGTLFQDYHPSLVLCGVYFSLGFLATNFAFNASTPAFVETIKAAEPITSAAVAVWWGIEILGKEEVLSLGAIVAGVLLSTLGNQGGAKDNRAATYNITDSLQAFLIVLVGNMCFSFRGLHQKLFRATAEGSASVVDDLNLQFRMQQIGVAILILPVLAWDMPGIMAFLWNSQLSPDSVWKYAALALLNGFAFCSYNLASTFILSRISVVHHAALNCIRRIFAVVVTSIFFAVPITLIGCLGICISFIGFMSFTHYKIQRQQKHRAVSSLLPVSAVNNNA